MKQADLLKILQDNNLVVKIVENTNFTENISDITYNSKECVNNSVFFVKGKNFKEEYVIDAVDRGAMLIISEKEYYTKSANIILVNNVRLAMVLVANVFFEKPYKDIILTGITGTKGKTTTTYFIKNILDEYLGCRSGLISTVETYTGVRDEESHLTTPEAIELQRYFKEMKDSNIKYCTMEVASQAYKVDRIKDMEFNTGLFLNISEDHISDAEHPNFNDYFECKLKFIRSCKTVVINYETDFFETVLDAASSADKIITYGTEKSKDKAEYYVDNVEKLDSGFAFLVHHGENVEKYSIKMQGRFNIENALAAIVIAKLYNIPSSIIQKGLAETEVQGRMNVYESQGITAIVDYAHNKLSFTKFFESLKLDYPNRKIITIAGGPGGKSYARRKDLGEIAGSISDYMYLTEEDPQFEEVEDICRDIATYVKCPYEIVVDRTSAIEKAFSNAMPGDVLVLLAKGEEDYQKRKGTFVHYESDVKIIKGLFKID